MYNIIYNRNIIFQFTMVDNVSEKKGFLMRVVAVTVNWQLLRLAGSCGYKCGNYAVF